MAIMFNVPVSELIDDETPGVQPPDDLELTAAEHELLTLYRGVNPDGQRYIMKQAQFASSQKEYCPTPAPIARSAG